MRRGQTHFSNKKKYKQTDVSNEICNRNKEKKKKKFYKLCK